MAVSWKTTNHKAKKEGFIITLSVSSPDLQKAVYNIWQSYNMTWRIRAKYYNSEDPKSPQVGGSYEGK